MENMASVMPASNPNAILSSLVYGAHLLLIMGRQTEETKSIEQFSNFQLCTVALTSPGNPAAGRRQITSSSYRGVVEPFARVLCGVPAANHRA